MALKKKKGSSLITIVVVFGVLTTLGIATLSLVAADYRMRIVQSKKTQSLYYSDSGINVVQAAIKKIVEQAVDKGNKAAEDFLKSDLSTYIKPDGTNSYLNEDGTINKAAVDAEAKRLFREEYKIQITGYLNDPNKKSKLENGIYFDKSNTEHNLFNPTLISKPTVTIEYSGGTAAFTGTKELLNINLTSSFESTPLSGETTNLKKVTAKLTIAAAEYNKAYGVNSSAVTIQVNPIWKNAISIDGNLKLKKSVEVHGDVFVRAILPTEVTNKPYTKYNGGIALGEDDILSSSDINSNRIVFNGDVITGGSFNISGQNRLVEVNGTVYARNVYIGKTLPTSENSKNLQLKVSTVSGKEAATGAVYTVNDLALNALASKIELDKYYGINDINLQKDFRSGIDKDFNSSSSIIINTDDIGKAGGSSVEIKNEAVIMGAAYVNTAKAYQTGESVAIKGNYMAYTQPIVDSSIAEDEYKIYGENNINFDYYDPLQFATSRKDKATDNELSIYDKAKYIELADSLKLLPGGNGINKSGIKLPPNDKLITAGASLREGEFVKSTYTPRDTTDNRINALKEHFAETVYDRIGNKSYDLGKVYILGKLNRTVFDGVSTPEYGTDNALKNSVSQVLLSDSSYNRNTRENNMIQFISYDEDAIILGEGWETSFSGSDTASNVIKTNNLPIKGIIVTKKDVKVYGKVDFTGTIIAGGDFTAEDGERKVFRSNESFMQSLIATYYENTYKKIFNNSYSTGTQEITLAKSVSAPSADTGEAFQNDLVKLSNWKIDK